MNSKNKVIAGQRPEVVEIPLNLTRDQQFSETFTALNLLMFLVGFRDSRLLNRPLKAAIAENPFTAMGSDVPLQLGEDLDGLKSLGLPIEDRGSGRGSLIAAESGLPRKFAVKVPEAIEFATNYVDAVIFDLLGYTCWTYEVLGRYYRFNEAMQRQISSTYGSLREEIVSSGDTKYIREYCELGFSSLRRYREVFSGNPIIDHGTRLTWAPNDLAGAQRAVEALVSITDANVLRMLRRWCEEPATISPGVADILGARLEQSGPNLGNRARRLFIRATAVVFLIYKELLPSDQQIQVQGEIRSTLELVRRSVLPQFNTFVRNNGRLPNDPQVIRPSFVVALLRVYEDRITKISDMLGAR